jgi:hypothetical protein
VEFKRRWSEDFNTHEIRRGIDSTLGEVFRQGASAQVCGRIDKRYAESFFARYSSNARAGMEYIYAWSNACQVDLCEAGVRPGHRREPARNQLARASEQSPTSPDNPFLSRNAPSPSEDNPFAQPGTPSPSADNPFSQRAPSASRPPMASAPRAGGGACVAYFNRTSDELWNLAARCANLAEGMTGLADMLTRDGALDGFGHLAVRRSTAEKIFVRVLESERAWTRSGDLAIPKCELPIRVISQRETFTECVRAYMCGYQAASCGKKLAQTTGSGDCFAIATACKATNPIPEGLEELAEHEPPALQRPVGGAGAHGSTSRVTGSPTGRTGGAETCDSPSNCTAPAR